ncbi:uncharacterized protein [Drosophila virilis]|uniref:Uncharacterized protein n=1 Tax=Drosophila virilis TaxID=7244 RepID=B4LR42_DROVI|nr:uncharacterized protein LOC6628687 [Drosophila virilis]EDW63506.1 uncharacterized protein Dvir_GJ12729 [Drosophila virilis]
MSSSLIILGCAFLAILMAHLPVGEAVTCAEEPNNIDCVDCTAEINIDDAECIAEYEDYEEYNDGDVDTITRRPGRRPGWRRGGRRGGRPKTILGSILQKKMRIIKGIKQG